MNLPALDHGPLIVAIAGPNGAGKMTFFHAHLATLGLRFVNADVLADELAIEAYAAARLADSLRRALVSRRESFVFETVFSDPVGDKVQFLEDCVAAGYSVVLCFVGLSRPEQSIERVAMRVSQGGHDVPDDKLLARFDRSLLNLQLAIHRLPHVLVYDNSDLGRPYQTVAIFEHGRVLFRGDDSPDWVRPFIGPT